MAAPAQNQAATSTQPDQFVSAFGEPLSQTLDLSTWAESTRLGDLYANLQQEVKSAQEVELKARATIRQKVFPQIEQGPSAPPGAGVYKSNAREIEAVQRGLLFSGAVEACQGIAATHESLALTVTQLGICLVSYHADMGMWVHRLYRRDLREPVTDPVKQAVDLINKRHGGEESFGLQPNRLARRSVLAYAERATLLEKSSAPWRMCHGNPLPVELLAGSGSPDLVVKSIEMLEQLIMDHQKILFVPQTLEQPGIATIADALKPLEYAIVGSMTDRLRSIIRSHHYSDDVAKQLRAFVQKVGPKLVIGCYRASEIGPARLFYAHVDHAHEAAQIAIADSTLQSHRSYPVLLDLAGEICRTSFGQSDFIATLQDAYNAVGQPYAFHQEFGSGR